MKNIFIIILSVVVIGLGGFIFYDKVHVSDKTKENAKDNASIIEKFDEKVAGYTNIVGVQIVNSWDAHDYKLIDIYGNKY